MPAHLKLENVYALQATRVYRNAVPIAGPEHRCAASRAEMVACICITPEIGGKPTLACDEADRFHRHLPVNEPGAGAGRAVALVKPCHFGIDVQPDSAAVAGERPRHRSAPPSIQAWM